MKIENVFTGATIGRLIILDQSLLDCSAQAGYNEIICIQLTEEDLSLPKLTAMEGVKV